MDKAPHPQRPEQLARFVLAVGLLLPLAGAGDAPAQTAESAPGLSYFAGIEELYGGDHRNASRIFRRELNQGVRVGTTRWVDSICYYSMQGEVLYQLGNHADALAFFDQACQLFMQHPDWLTRVQFRANPRDDANRGRQAAPPWGTSERQARLGNIPDSMLVLLGRQPTAQDFQQQPGPRTVPVLTPHFFQLRVQEIVRATALAIRRRNEILGPLSRHDRISKDLAATLTRGGLTAPNHWSSAWVELQLGLAQIGVGNLEQAHTHLNRALTIDGRFDHSLTCVALLEQGRLALEAGNGPLAARLFAEASFSAYYYDNWNVVDEALRLGHLNHLVTGGQGVYPPLEIAAEWARRRGLRLLASNFHIARAENLAILGQTAAAAAGLEEAGRLIGPMTAGKPGTHLLYVQAMLHQQQRRNEAAERTLNEAISRQAATSLRAFQLARTNMMFDGGSIGRISSRVAVELYESLLSDPAAADWAYRPLDTLALLSTPLEDSYDRWLLATLDRKEILKAVDIAELAKRRRFLASLPWGGRLHSLRFVLEAPPAALTNDALIDRQRILADFPDYQELAAAGTEIEQQLAGMPLWSDDQQLHSTLSDLYKRWEANLGKREHMLRLIALSREPAPLLFPPMIPAGQLQQELDEGQLIVLFHVVADELHGFLLTRDNYHHWRLGPVRHQQQAIAELLRKLGNYSATHTFSPTELADSGWRQAGHELYRLLFAESRIEPEKILEMIIVPDDALWYLTFEVLIPEGQDDSPLLADTVRIRYVPTAGLAVGDRRPLARVQTTGIVAGQHAGGMDREFLDKAMDRLAGVVEGATELPEPLKAPAPLIAARIEQLVSMADVPLEMGEPYGWTPMPRDRGRTNHLASLMALPWAGPERIILAGFSTAAETGLKNAKRRGGPRQVTPGSELFRATCGLMASGARTVLLARWRTGGETNLALVREFAQELPHVPASDAWQRAMLVARELPMDAAREPRLKVAERDVATPLTATHPFFWAGYLLIDTGVDPGALDELAEEEAPEPVVRLNEEKQP